MIPCADPKAQYLAQKDEIDAAIARVMSSGWYILGKEVREFEAEFALYVGVHYGIGVGSGTEALHLALAACDIGPGDEVVTVSHTAVATVAAIVLAGARPVFADIDPVTFTMDPASLQQKIGPRTRAIVAVHLYGHPAAMTEISFIAKEHNLRLIEDCAQAHGAAENGRRIGNFGDMACFSFYPTKNLGAIGDGGMVVTNDQKLAEKAGLLREYGWKERYVSHQPGWNTRLDELQAAILRVKLRRLDDYNQARQRIAAFYKETLADTNLTLPVVRKGATHVYHLYVVQSKDRDGLAEYLRSKEICTAVHYPVPVHLQPAYEEPGGENLPRTEQAAAKILSLPMYPELAEKDVFAVVRVIKEFEK